MRPRYAVVAALLLAAAAAPARAQETLKIEVAARELAPREPLRVHVSSPAPLSTLRGVWLGDAVHFSRTDDRGLDWTGWTMIGLDAEAREATLEVYGVATDGRTLSESRTLSIREKSFPEENLKVSSKYVEPPKEVQRRIARERARLAEIYARREPVIPVSRPFVRPVPGVNTSIFGMRRLFNGQPRSPHPGLDLRAETGTPVHASGPGKVVLADELYYSGNLVILDHGGGLFTLYAHLSEIAVDEGDDVAAGDVLGRSGATGRVTGPHLHWGAKIGDRPFDPEALLDSGLF